MEQEQKTNYDSGDIVLNWNEKAGEENEKEIREDGGFFRSKIALILGILILLIAGGVLYYYLGYT